MNKLLGSAEEAIADVQDGASIMFGGFGLSGNAENLISALRAKGVRELTVISNNCGTTELGLGVLLANKQVRKFVGSFFGANKSLETQYLAGEVEVEFNPQGTLSERIRAGGVGIGGFFTPTGVGTLIAEGKETRVINGREHIFETPLKADYAFVRAWKGDAAGNLVFRRTSRNFSPLMCMAGKVTIAEVEHLVPVGEIDPDDVHTPSIFVQRVIQGVNYQKWIERRTVRPRPAAVGA